MSEDTLYKRQDILVGAQVDESYVILDVTTDKYYAFNPSAKEIWELLAEPMSAGAITDALCVRYEVSADAAYASVMNVIAGLQAKGLIAVV